MTGTETEPDPDSLDALLCAALDGNDARRVELMTLLAIVRIDVLREEDLDRLRREGVPPVFKL